MNDELMSRTMEKSYRTCIHNFCLERGFCVLKYVRIGNIDLIRVLEHMNITSMQGV